MGRMVEKQAKKILDSFLNEISDHSKRVAEIAVTITQGLSLPQDDIDKIRLAGWASRRANTNGG